MRASQDLSAHSWLQVRSGRVVSPDFEAYVRHAGRMELQPASDALDRSSGENQLFDTASADTQHFKPCAAPRRAARHPAPAKPAPGW